MGENKLVGIVNTEVNRQKAAGAKDAAEKADYESRAVYAELDDRLRKATFREVIEEIAGNSQEGAAPEIKEYLAAHNGANTFCEVRVYNADNTKKKRIGAETEIIRLDDRVAGYIDQRHTADGIAYDCLDMAVKRYDDVGCR
ncbi:MAG TPA: hypothetical protein HA362_02300 [Nanoarchaeota archaeon]|nr:hypothetical protein [Nanoarchaeota archaeon]